MATTTRKVPVSARALIQRINRKLQADDQILKTTRGARAKSDLGDLYVLDWRRNSVMRKDVDLEALGREVGALADFEHLIEEN